MKTTPSCLPVDIEREAMVEVVEVVEMEVVVVAQWCKSGVMWLATC